MCSRPTRSYQRQAQSALRLAVLAAGGLLLAAFAQASERKPNFLFVYTDDQRWDAMGVVQREQGEQGRFPWFRTPNMDRLASEGTRFRNAFVTSSLCSPSRAAFLTGRYNHLNGIANNHTGFPEGAVTHATLLKAAGYATAYIGKWHMGPQRGQRPGFDYSASFVGQGRYENCPFEINGVVTQTSGWVDDISTDYAVDFMKQHREQPFSIVVGFKACHGPFTPPGRARDRFAGERARPVPNLNVRAVYRDSVEAPPRKKKARAGNALADGNINLNYFRCISAADDNLGRLLKALDDFGIADDTVVVFASDNGFYNGEHGLGDKRSAYDESLRIPLLVRYPKLVAKGTISDELVLNIDLAPTFLDLAGVSIPREIQGQSWKPLLAGKPVAWRQSFLAEYFFESNFLNTPTLVAVRTKDAKLVKYPGHEEWTELFNLAADPYETNNLAGDPNHKQLLSRLTEEFNKQVQATGYRVPDYADVPAPSSEREN